MSCHLCHGGVWGSSLPCHCTTQPKYTTGYVVSITDEPYRLPPLPTFTDLPAMPSNPGRFPHRCPICDGSGQYLGKTCHGCEGKGIVWG